MAETVAESIWYYTQQDQRMGPVPIEQLQQLVQRGEVKGHDLVWTDGMGQWTRADHLPILHPSPQPVVQLANISTEATPVISVATRVEYARPIIALPPRAVAAFNGHAHPAGDTGNWPLDDLQLQQFEQAAELHRKVRGAARLYHALMILSATFGGIMLIGAIAQFGSSAADAKSSALGFVMFAVISLGFAVIYFFAWRGTIRSKQWAPLCMFSLSALGGLLNLILMLVLLTKSPLGVFSAFIGLLVLGLFATISWRSFAAIPKYLAQPAWCQELLIKARL